MAVNCSERKKPPTSSRPDHQRHRRRRREERGQRDEDGGDHRVDDQHVAEAEAAEDRRRDEFHGHRADRGGEGDQARLERRHAEAELEQQRQQERRRARCRGGTASRRSRCAGRSGCGTARGRGSGGRCAGACSDIGDEQRRPADDEAPASTASGSRPRPSVVEPVMKRGEPEAEQGEAGRVEADLAPRRARRACSRVARTKPRMPTGTLIQKIHGQLEIGGDEAADRRPEDRADQRRHGEPGERADQLRFLHRAQDHQPADRHHHRAADALHDAREDDHLDRTGKARTAIEPAMKMAIADAEDQPRAEAVGQPAGGRDEDGDASADRRSAPASGGSGSRRNPGRSPAAPSR